MDDLTTNDIIELCDKRGLTELADTFQYFKNHLKDYEEGNINAEDLPCNEGLALLVRLSVAFGTKWEKEVPADR